MTRVLVAYGTKHGGTGEIAQAIAATLREHGLDVDLTPAGEIREPAGYDAYVVGSALYMGKWQRDAMDVLKRGERELAAHPTWLFSSGPTGGSEELDAAVRRANDDPGGVPPVKDVAKRAERIRARGHATFGGRIGEDMTGIFERWMPRGDWRNFDQVEAWAGSIAGALRAG
jgi:menaquinone-dependent protoporphyrinogen oxidase